MTWDFKSHIFHDGVTVISSGADLKTIGLQTVSVHIKRVGAGSSSTVQFQVSTNGTDFVPINGVNTTTLAVATSTTGTGEDWEFKVPGKALLRMNLSAIGGSGATMMISGNGVP